MPDVGTMIPVEQYLRTSYPDGDRDYVDGLLLERNVGEIDHSDAQTAASVYLRANYRRFWVGVEVRVQVRPTRFRVPDVTVMSGGKPSGRIIQAPPVLVIEVLSPDDRAGDLEEKLDDYLVFGIPCVWIVNPRTRRARVATLHGSTSVTDGLLRTPDNTIQMPLSAVFLIEP